MAEALQHAKPSKNLCRYFQQGACQFGDSCKNSHSWSDKPSSVCTYYQRGSCSYGSHCRYDHVRDVSLTNSKLLQASKINSKATSSRSASNTVGLSNVMPDMSSERPCKISNGNSHAVTKANIVRPCPVIGSNNTPVKENMVTLGKGAQVAPAANPLSGQLSVEQWVTASEFVPGQLWQGISLPCSYRAAVKADSDLPPESDVNNEFMPFTRELCPFYAYGECRNGDNCQYLHGEICDMCQLPVLMPFDIDQQNKHFQECLSQHEKDMEISFALDRSKDKVCGICMEVVLEKEPEIARRFGILSSCSHVYCLDCIRKWRDAKQFENKVIRACPECRVKSNFVTPSKYWVDVKEDKEKLIDEYKQGMSKKPCKYFNEGKGECPFNNKCFYLHAYPDGRIASPRPWNRRHRQDADGAASVIGPVLLWDFLDEFEEGRARRLAADRSRGDDWDTFFARLQMLDIALPSDDEDNVSYLSSATDSDHEDHGQNDDTDFPPIVPTNVNNAS